LTLKAPEDQRDGLIRFIEQKKPQGSPKNKVTIIFDGRPGRGGRGESSVVEIIFSQDESADDRIKRMVEDSKHKKSIVVVTDDRDIQYAVRASGAQVLGVGAFLSKMQPSAKRSPLREKSSGTVSDAKHISKTLEEKITSEFETIWLKKKSEGHP